MGRAGEEARFEGRIGVLPLCSHIVLFESGSMLYGSQVGTVEAANETHNEKPHNVARVHDRR